MFKKLLIALVVILILAAASMPLWTTKMAEEAFKKPESPMSPVNLKKAVQLKMYMYMYPESRKISEKAVIYFPESREFPYFIYSAALCAEKENNPTAAIYWYGYFIERFPKHEWTTQAQNHYNKLKGLHQNN